MKFEPALQRGVLVRRYKRFLADILLPDGSVVTIHCPNTGSMKNCADPGDEVWYSTSSNMKRKYAHTWELSRTKAGQFIGINTNRANGLVMAGIENGKISELAGYDRVRREVRYGSENSRVDFKLEGNSSQPDCFVEVKSVTLLEAPVSRNVGYFPDSVSSRAERHVRELVKVVEGGERGVLCFCVQHSGIRQVRPAAHIDPAYAAALTDGVERGVEVLAYKARLSPRGVHLFRPVPVILEP